MVSKQRKAFPGNRAVLSISKIVTNGGRRSRTGEVVYILHRAVHAVFPTAES